MLSLRNYRKTYAGQTVLHIDHLQLAHGIWWVKGENGAGKTTLFKSVAGLIPFDGDIDVAGLNLRKQRRPYTQIVSFAEAEPIYPGFLTGHDLLKFYWQTKGGDQQQLLQIATALAIQPYLSAKTETYSSGMLKKLSLVLAFVGKSKLILLDEPFITLDTEAVNVLRQLICQQLERGVSFLVSSHQELSIDAPYRCLHLQQQTLQPESDVAGA